MNLFCWAHIRRYFVRAGDANPAQLAYWTAAWLERIKDPVRRARGAHGRLGRRGPAPREAAGAAARLEQAQAAWDAALAVIDEARKKQMAAPGLQEPAKKALATLDRQWDGLAAHRDYPMISLDNNAAERALRRPVVTRKNAYGSRNDDAARLAARIWTVTATAEMAGLNVLTYLTAYLDACGRNGGNAAGRARPGTIPALDRRPRGPARLDAVTPPRLTSRRPRHGATARKRLASAICAAKRRGARPCKGSLTSPYR